MASLGGVDGAVRGWIDGLALAMLRIIDRLRPAPVIILSLDGEGGAPAGLLHRAGEADKPPLGRLIAEVDGVRLEPAAALRVLRGSDLRLRVPDGWILERTLAPVPTKSRPFLDAYVRRQIERVTPWRAADCFYTTRTETAPDGPERLAVSITVVLRRLVEPTLAPLIGAGLRRLCIEPDGTKSAEAGVRGSVTLPAVEAVRLQQMRRLTGGTVAVVVIGVVAGLGATAWIQAGQQARLDTLDQAIAAKRRQMAAITARRATGEGDAMQIPPAPLPPAIVRLDRLSALLPDSAYVTDLTFEGDRVRLAGISTEDVAALIPLIERSGLFSEAHFYAPTTKREDQQGQRFFIEMRVTSAGPAASPVKRDSAGGRS
ncbi:hypothetical protein BJF93_12795 [Xaviernesmea oryzae]|uniref:Uncharacterized protein n=1 Tax=Xaviernesmea oryzae TaxID=464029 RepID=A0A1Q9AQP8_9HYPH|nr:PilN domain-containing protein [Xaviernesmea oryzae]OLP57740.1 hypothetical protein BJF93_12795 [Xaviernesmea oryzae]SEM06281.1 Fimbrial assembly protein (PilN) [Xaviernesmea oryzae]